MSRSTALIVAMVLMALLVLPAAAEDGWHSTKSKGIKAAKQSGKAILYVSDGLPVRPAGFCNVNNLFELNTEQAIWTRPKEEISDEEYQGFWKVVNKQANEDATAWSHFDAEGNINFKSLVYLPSEIPPQLLQGNMDEYRGGLKLYVRKVLISDEFELMPRYLSFIRGVSTDVLMCMSFGT